MHSASTSATSTLGEPIISVKLIATIRAGGVAVGKLQKQHTESRYVQITHEGKITGLPQI